MRRPIFRLIRTLMVVIPLLLALAPALAQTNIVNVGQTTELSVIEMLGDTYNWELYNDVSGVNFVTVPGNCQPTEAFFEGGITTGPIVHVTWLSPGTYFYKVTSRKPGCSMNLKAGKIIVQQWLPTATLSLEPPQICLGQGTSLSIHLTGTAPWSITYRITGPNGGIQNITVSNITTGELLIPFIPPAAGIYSFMVISVSDAFATNSTSSNSVSLTVTPKPGSSHIYQYNPVSKKK